MVYRIMYKEILENLLSLRFVLSLLLIILLFSASGFIFVLNYKQESQNYWKKANKESSALNEKLNRLNDLAFHKQQVFQKPKPLTLCVDGYEKYFPNSIKFDIFTISLPEVIGSGNSTLHYFSNINWIFIIGLILSFVAFVFTFDCICGEKEAGTLRMILAVAIPRHKILFGKYLGIMFTLCIPLLIGLLVNLIIVISFNVTAINGLDWLKILIIVILSFLYLSVFVFLGIFVSSRATNSANCMSILLLVWVSLVILIPSLGRTVSCIFYKASTNVELNRKLLETDRNFRNDAERFGKNAGYSCANANDPSMNLPARARWLNAWAKAKNQIREKHHNTMIEQALTGRNFTCLSPTVVYQRASETIASVGISRCVDFYRQVKRYRTNLKEFIRNKDAEDPDSRHLLFDEDNSRGAFDWGTISKKPVDFGAVPKFQEQDMGLRKSLQLAIWDIGLLVLFNLVFFVAAFVAFLGYDVR